MHGSSGLLFLCSPHQAAAGIFRLLAVAVLLASVSPARGGAGISLFSVFEPKPSGTATTETAHRVAIALHGEVRRLMDEHEVWGIELLTLDAATSAATNLMGTRAPQWKGQYTPEWVAVLNTNEMITYAAVGEVTAEPTGGVRAEYSVWDLILNHPIGSFSAKAASPEQAGQELGRRVLAALQLYFAEITEVGRGKALVNVGLESLSTGTLLVAYAHGHLGAHRAGYPAHGHREEDDHLLGSTIFARYRGTVPTSSSLHSHSRSRWRSLLRNFPPALEELVTTATAVVPPPTPRAGLKAPGMPSAAMTTPADILTTPSAEELRLLNLAHYHSGRPTGVLKVVGFVKPHRYFNSYYAVAEVVEGVAIPGGFVRPKESAAPKAP